MTISTDGQICYGILFEEDFDFPWYDGYDGLEDWWIAVQGYKPTQEIYDSNGEYLNGIQPSEAISDAYWKERSDFEAAHPLPICLVNVCSNEYQQFIIAIEDTVKTANRGFPVSFDPAELVATDAMRETLLNFCEDYHIDIGAETPKWWLSSYWG